MSNDDSRYTHVLDSLLKLSTRLKPSRTPQEMLSIMADEIRDVTDADFSSIHVLDRDGTSFRASGLSGFDPKASSAFSSVRIDENFRKLVSQSGQSAVFRLEYSEKSPEFVRPLAEAAGAGESLICQIVMRGELLGYATASKKRGGSSFTKEAEKALGALSVGIAFVIENIKVYDSLTLEREQGERVLGLAPIGLFVCDPKGIFRSLNEQMLLILDTKSDSDLVGTSAFEIPSFHKSGIDTLILQAMEGHEGEKSDVHLVLRPDKALYLHAKATPIKSKSGEIEGIMLVAMDVTSKVRLQNQLERSYEKLTQTYQELERVTKMKTQFIDIVSHELRTPLTVMRGYIDLMESEYSSQMDAKFASRLRIIKANTDKLYGLVENMLDVSRLEKGSMQIHPEPVRIDIILEEIMHVRVHDAEEKSQSLSLSVEGALPLIMADRRRLKDVFNSIVDNALKYTQEGGRIQVYARDEGRMIHVWVKDNGVGIPLENLGKIFDRFHIVTSNELSHQVDRLGLGLPIAKGIIEAHGGRIWVESQVGKGSVFHVDLPKEQHKTV